VRERCDHFESHFRAEKAQFGKVLHTGESTLPFLGDFRVHFFSELRERALARVSRQKIMIASVRWTLQGVLALIASAGLFYAIDRLPSFVASFCSATAGAMLRTTAVAAVTAGALQLAAVRWPQQVQALREPPLLSEQDSRDTLRGLHVAVVVASACLSCEWACCVAMVLGVAAALQCNGVLLHPDAACNWPALAQACDQQLRPLLATCIAALRRCRGQQQQQQYQQQPEQQRQQQQRYSDAEGDFDQPLGPPQSSVTSPQQAPAAPVDYSVYRSSSSSSSNRSRVPLQEDLLSEQWANPSSSGQRISDRLGSAYAGFLEQPSSGRTLSSGTVFDGYRLAAPTDYLLPSGKS
jgi:hypothetical protein